MFRAALLILLFRSCLRCFQLSKISINYEHLWNVYYPGVRGRTAYVRLPQAVRWIPEKRVENKGHAPDEEVHHSSNDIDTPRGDLHIILNNNLQNVAKQILKDENVNLPKHCLLEDNKIFDDYEYQSSVILFLEHSLGKGKDVRSEVLRIFKGADAELIDSIRISPNGILNIRVADAFVLRDFLQFYRQGRAHIGTAPVGVDYASNNNPEMENPRKREKSTVLLDFCGVNMAKNMHMGHLKSLLLGNALSNIFRSLNYSVKCRSHIGDWNMNLAIVLSFLIMFPYEVISGGKINGEKVHNISGADNDDKAESYKGCRTPCISTGQMNKHIDVEHRVSADYTESEVEKESEKVVEEEIYRKLENSLKEEKFNKGYEQLDPSKWENINLANIEFAYRMGKKLFTSSDVFKRISKSSLRMMYEKDEKMIALWDNICKSSKRANKEILNKMKIKKLIDKGESFYVKFVPTILRRLQDANMVFHLEGKSCLLLRSNQVGMNSVNGGCTPNRRKDTHILSTKEEHYEVVQVTQELLDQVKRNGVDELKKNFTLVTLENDVAFTYAAIDLAAIHYRVVHEKANKIIYVVDENQRKHFMQIFSIARFAHILSDDVECICLNYGFVLNSENKKMKTKDLCKKNISVKDMLENVKLTNNNAHEKNEQTNLNKVHMEKKHREKFLLSSLIYSYLSVKNYKRQIITSILKHSHTEYLFIINCYNEVSSILGNRKKGDYSSHMSIRKNVLIENNLKKLMLHIIHFNYVTEEVTRNYGVDRLCSFLFILSQKMQPLLQSRFLKKFIPHLESASAHNFLKTLNGLREAEVQEHVKNAVEENAPNRTESIIDWITQTELYLLIKNSGLVDLREDENLPEQSGKIETFIFNRIFEVLIMQTYLTLVRRIFKMLNLQLVNSGQRDSGPRAADL
ncbi:arginine--tRNA ligase, putative [Plasmodium knowlesi strain H]|uniref:Arginine--tRNA ligase, putative n=3 Tax=Plasmodium knowlesi TaxID=5850 RepID=A0A5K1UWS3_PLAKH|nr:arginine--tRNA ligase, putative [Plasmodium knowlesi strain H]OTN67528.1 putative Arginine--tRNA ligase [Plasmodium knowlesi]CAA9987409.1 arginine--tRNA ligase, putative [Plasmodium knowlesi strain H]SBO23290.1 arginine--tRNA ligase, putative [Plasmodium knowlesi strain H]SBO24327.1 arginine--tRNA ligase, putative [Plasmodium knowlesi strain H]VVS76883.1 arginine--tRNA ligase, putative [Plasmodium knowlesi strain H]|eukprot:XP_002258410.1 hypothetical protein, conserved in Plasmodium species [Plasmodium knowlesi strain H]